MADIIFGLGGEDTIVTGDGDDILDGGSGNDVLEGGEGDDVLNGQTGADTLNGGNGNDTYGIDDVGDVIVDTGGNDLVRSSISYSLEGQPLDACS